MVVEAEHRPPSDGAHVEVANALGRYAAGTADPAMAELVRRHLATGCQSCLQRLWAAPVGLPRGPDPAQREPVTWQVLVAALAVIALTGTLWISHAVRRPAGGGHEPSRESVDLDVRLNALEDGSRRVAGRATSLGSEARALEANVATLASRLARAADAERRLLGSDERLRRRVARLERAQETVGAIATALGSPSTRLLRLASVETRSAAFGHVAWDPQQWRVFVYAAGLPRLAEAWEVRLEGGRHAALTRRGDGGLFGLIEVPSSTACPFTVEIAAGSAGAPVLAGRVDGCAAPPRG